MFWPFTIFSKEKPVQVTQKESPMEIKEFTFTNREEYFEYRKKWKEDYFKTILDIRKSAIARREAERAFSRSTGVTEAHEMYDTRRNHRNLKETATELLAERARSKVEAGRQRALQRIPSVV